jgi:hypothetical protein
MILLAEWTCPLENNYVERDWGWNEDVIWEHGRDTDDKPKNVLSLQRKRICARR